jgi:O-antigen/teichoic acid export membrane protein
MEKRTDKTLLFKGIKTLVFALMSLFMGPILLSFAFSKPDDKLYIPLLVIGCAICAMAVFMVFKGIKTIMSSMFGKK